MEIHGMGLTTNPNGDSNQPCQGDSFCDMNGNPPSNLGMSRACCLGEIIDLKMFKSLSSKPCVADSQKISKIYGKTMVDMVVTIKI